MGTENNDTTSRSTVDGVRSQPVTAAEIAAALAKPAETVAAPAAPPAPAATQAPTAPPDAAPPAAPAPPAGDRVVTLNDDGEIPQDATLLQLSKSALKSRLERYSRKELKDRFGTDNPDEIKTAMEEAKQFREEKEARRVAALSETERAKEQVEQAQRERDEWKNRFKGVKTAQTLNRAQTRVESIAGEYLDPRYMPLEMPLFAKHLKDNFSREQLRNMSDQDIRGYFDNLVKERPQVAKVTPAAPAVPPKVVPLTARTKVKVSVETAVTYNCSLSILKVIPAENRLPFPEDNE